MASICRKDFSSTSAVFISRDDALINPDAIRTMTHPGGVNNYTHTNKHTLHSVLTLILRAYCMFINQSSYSKVKELKDYVVDSFNAF